MFIRKWLPIAGFLIIFATFIVRDVLRDEFKDLAADVDSSESLFIVTDVVTVPPDLAKSYQDLTEANFQEKFKDFFTIMIEQENYIQSSITTNERLLHRLPDQGERIKQLNQFESAFQKERSEANTQHDVAASKPVVEAGPGGKKKLSEDVVSVLTHFSKLIEMSMVIKTFSRQNLDIAERMREETKERYDFANHVSWGLFALGFLVAATGRKYGVEGLGKL